MDQTPAVLPGRSRPGQRFQAVQERGLQEALLGVARELPGSKQGLILQLEMPGPLGIPDATALVGNPARLEDRLQSGIAPLTNRLDATIVSIMPRGAMRSPTAIARQLKWRTETVDRRIPYLLRAGAIVARGDSFSRRCELGPLGRIYALEAKVNQAGAALKQCRTYSSWADSYVLVMGPLSTSTKERLNRDVLLDGGGLVVAGRWCLRPRLRPPDPSMRLWAAEYFVASLLEHQAYQPSVAP